MTLKELEELADMLIEDYDEEVIAYKVGVKIKEGCKEAKSLKENNELRDI